MAYRALASAWTQLLSRPRGDAQHGIRDVTKVLLIGENHPDRLQVSLSPPGIDPLSQLPSVCMYWLKWSISSMDGEFIHRQF